MNTAPRSSPESSPPDGFASTEWSLVLAASTEAGPALEHLCRKYWRPVYLFVRATGLPPAEAEDATQDFFADMLRRDWLKRADHDKGSFRGFLRSSVRFFLNNRRRESEAQKRGGGDVILSLDTADSEMELVRRSAEPSDPASLYEQSWANCLLEAAFARLAAEQARTSHPAQFAHLRPFVTSQPAPGDYARLADELGVTPGQVALRVHRLTQRLGELIRAEVAATLPDRREIETELRYLLRLVSPIA